MVRRQQVNLEPHGDCVRLAQYLTKGDALDRAAYFSLDDR